MLDRYFSQILYKMKNVTENLNGGDVSVRAWLF